MLLAIGAGGAAAAGGADVDNGAVYAMTNSTTGNAVVVFDRAADGTLTKTGTFPTGGTSIGDFATGNQNGLLLSNNGHCLWAVNSASNTISAFEAKGTSLSFVTVVNSNGLRPISLAVNEALRVLYVLNAGGQVGSTDNITGFTLDGDCGLSALDGSTRALSGKNVSPAQVGFDPSGTILVVTEKTNDSQLGSPPVRGGNIDTFIVVGHHGLLSDVGKHFSQPCGQGNMTCPVTEPFGFAFDNRGQLLVTAADCAHPEPPGFLPGCTVPMDHPSVLSYRVARDGALTLVNAFADDQAAKCWIVIANNQKFVFTVNALATQPGGTPGNPPAGSITGYHLSPNGDLTKLGVTLVPLNQLGVPVDASLSLNSRFLYVLSEGDGNIDAYKVGQDGGLTPLGTFAIEAVHFPPPPPPLFPNGLAAR
jgi:hypothetical protein